MILAIIQVKPKANSILQYKIPASEITPGADSSGKVYLTVYKADVVAFDEVNCDAFYCLPIQDIKVESGPFPIELNVKGFNGSITSKIQIDDVTYEYEKAIRQL